MGRITDIMNWGKKFVQSETASAAITDATHYAYETINHVFKQAATIPQVVRFAITHPPARTVTSHLLRVALQDVLPMSLIVYGNALLQERGPAYLRAEIPAYFNPQPEDDPWLTADTAIQAIQTCFYLIGATAWLISLNRKTDMKVRMTIINIEASPMLTEGQATDCVAHCQPGLKGPISNIAGYWAVYAVISLVESLPLVGEPIAAVLRFYHNGQFILALALPNLCNDHLSTYVRQNQELVLSLGLGHAASSWLISSLIERATGVPAVFLHANGSVKDIYASALKEVMMITQVMVAGRLALSPAQPTSTRVRTPLLLLEDGVDLGVEIALEGIKIISSRKRLNGQQIENFTNHLKYLGSITVSIHHNWLIQKILPDVLASTKSFTQDKIVSSSWKIVQPITVNGLRNIESLPNYWAVWLASCMPNVTGIAVEAVSGAPKSATKLLLKIITKPEAIEQMRNWRYYLEKLQIAAPSPIAGDKKIPLLAGQKSAKTALPSAASNPSIASGSLPAADDVIRKYNSAPPGSTLPASAVIRTSSKEIGPAVDPRPIIRGGFFSPTPPSEIDEEWVHIENKRPNAANHAKKM